MQLTLVLVLLQTAPSLTTLLDGVPGRTTDATLPARTVVDGLVVTQASCTSKASVDELLAHFAKAFGRAGLYLPPEQEGWQPETGAQVTGLDPEHLVSYTALLQPKGKAVTVVLAAADLGAKKLEPSGEPIAALFPGATDLTTFHLEGLSAMSYAVRATPAELKAFYRETLTKTGWSETAEPLRFVKGRKQLHVVVSPGVTERYVMVQLEDVKTD